MGKIQHLVCSAFIEKMAKDDKNALLKFLPPSEQEKYQSLHTPSKELCEGFDLTTYLINSVHYTWFTPFLRTLAEGEVNLFLAALPSDTANKLQKALLSPGTIPPASPALKSFLQAKLVKALLGDVEEVLPIEALPDSPLNCLLDLSTQEIRLLVEFLGLHDLAVEIKQIIDTVKLKKIHSILSKEKVFFLEMLSHKKATVTFKKMELSTWAGDVDLLAKLLQKRGMNRLAKALYPEDFSLTWHVKHRISSEEALLFSSLHKKLEQPKAYTLLAEQILEILTFFKKHKMQVHP